jgi:hypothetical protein
MSPERVRKEPLVYEKGATEKKEAVLQSYQWYGAIQFFRKFP